MRAAVDGGRSIATVLATSLLGEPEHYGTQLGSRHGNPIS